MVAELFEMLKDNFHNYSLRPDMGRALQCAFRFGNDKQRGVILKELQPHIFSLSKSKHGCFLIECMLRYAKDNQKEIILDCLKKGVRTLGVHARGARVLNMVFKPSKKVLSSVEKKKVQEDQDKIMKMFYGNDFLLATEIISKPSTRPKGASLLKCYINDFNQAQRKSILSNLKEVVMKQVEKGILRFSFAQKLLWDYVDCIDEKELEEMIPIVRESCLALNECEEGALCAEKCFRYADAKERKKFIKYWKDQVTGLCSHDYGFIILLRALDLVDDTVFMKKSVLSELIADDTTLINLLTDVTGTGRKVFMHLLSPYNSHYFTPTEITLFKNKEGSSSKKDDETRRKELLEELSPKLIEICESYFDLLQESRYGRDLIFEVVKQFKPETLMQMIQEHKKNNPKVQPAEKKQKV